MGDSEGDTTCQGEGATHYACPCVLAERDRYKAALEEIASKEQPLDFDDMACARSALDSIGEAGSDSSPSLSPSPE